MENIKYPTWHLKRTPLYHITHINNLDNIFDKGALCAKNHLNHKYENIAHDEIQDKRSRKMVPMVPNTYLHDYVPFYFAPRSPMLYKNNVNSTNDGKSQNDRFPNAKSQETIIYFVTNAEEIHGKRPYVFYDMHALKALAQCYNDIKDLNKIKWNIFYEKPLTGDYSKYWQDKYDDAHPDWINRMDLRQAEFLIYEEVNLQYIDKIATMTEACKKQVLEKLNKFNINISVTVEKDWFFRVERK